MAPTPTSGACWNGAVAMSNKPPKHSEVKKKSAAKRMRASWGKPRAAAPSIRIRPERFLIVTEGTKTEPFYFEGFRKRINAGYHGEYVTLRVCGVGDNTVSLFERARTIALADPDGFTQVWVVYDKDSFPSRDFNAVEERCASASGTGTVTAQRGPTRPSSCGTYSTSPTSTPRWTEVLTNPFSRVIYAPRVSVGTKRTERTCSISSKGACLRRSQMRRGSRSPIGVLPLQIQIRARRSICLSRSCCPI